MESNKIINTVKNPNFLKEDIFLDYLENNNNPLTNEGFIEPKMEIFDKFFNEEENSQKSNMLSNKSYSQMHSPFINYINNSEKKKIINGGQEKNNIDNKINTNLNPIENFEDNNGMKKQLFNINTKLFNIEDLRKKKLIMNRESAKKSRLKKKKYVQNLEKEYTFLKEEMIRLKSSKYVTNINSNNNEKYSINLCSNKIIDNIVKNQNNNININLNLNNKEKEIFDLKNQEKEIIVNNLEKNEEIVKNYKKIQKNVLEYLLVKQIDAMTPTRIKTFQNKFLKLANFDIDDNISVIKNKINNNINMIMELYDIDVINCKNNKNNSMSYKLYEFYCNLKEYIEQYDLIFNKI